MYLEFITLLPFVLIPQKNIDYYTQLLGLRLVKLTVNFDDPTTYHLYYGDEIGHPGTILTFFPWPDAQVDEKDAIIFPQ